MNSSANGILILNLFIEKTLTEEIKQQLIQKNTNNTKAEINKEMEIWRSCTVGTVFA